MEKKKFSLTYRFLRAIGLYYSEEEYGQVTIGYFLGKVYRTYRNAFISRFLMDAWDIQSYSCAQVESMSCS